MYDQRTGGSDISERIASAAYRGYDRAIPVNISVHSGSAFLAEHDGESRGYRAYLYGDGAWDRPDSRCINGSIAYIGGKARGYADKRVITVIADC